MKVVLVAAVTADGFIARHPGQTSMEWTSGADKQHFRDLTKRLGTVVVGSSTYATIGRPLPDRRMLVMSSHPRDFEQEGLEGFSGTAAELVAKLEHEGVESVAVIGGSKVYGQFLAGGLVNELVLTVEPRLFGEGINLAAAELDLKLKLTDVQRLGEDSLILTYEVA